MNRDGQPAGDNESHARVREQRERLLEIYQAVSRAVETCVEAGEKKIPDAGRRFTESFSNLS